MNLPSWTIARGLMLGLVMAACGASGAQAGAVLPDVEARALPRFTEEREAAALCFVKKQLPDLVPLLEQLKKNNAK
ncbi:MAG TPA: hypothetical protein VGG61_16225, partial [Gemmataceae bacterium]